jgi:hypothetical protein
MVQGLLFLLILLWKTWFSPNSPTLLLFELELELELQLLLLLLWESMPARMVPLLLLLVALLVLKSVEVVMNLQIYIFISAPLFIPFVLNFHSFLLVSLLLIGWGPRNIVFSGITKNKTLPI